MSFQTANIISFDQNNNVIVTFPFITHSIPLSSFNIEERYKLQNGLYCEKCSTLNGMGYLYEQPDDCSLAKKLNVMMFDFM